MEISDTSALVEAIVDGVISFFSSNGITLAPEDVEVELSLVQQRRLSLSHFRRLAVSYSAQVRVKSKDKATGDTIASTASAGSTALATTTQTQLVSKGQTGVTAQVAGVSRAAAASPTPSPSPSPASGSGGTQKDEKKIKPHVYVYIGLGVFVAIAALVVCCCVVVWHRRRKRNAARGEEQEESIAVDPEFQGIYATDDPRYTLRDPHGLELLKIGDDVTDTEDTRTVEVGGTEEEVAKDFPSAPGAKAQTKQQRRQSH